MGDPDANQGCTKSPHLVPEGCHQQQEPFLVKGKPRCARLSFHKRKGFYPWGDHSGATKPFLFRERKDEQSSPVVSVQ